jgi:hypothetical protein
MQSYVANQSEFVFTPSKIKYSPGHNSRTARVLQNTSGSIKACRTCIVLAVFMFLMTLVFTAMSFIVHVFTLPGVDAQIAIYDDRIISQMPNHKLWRVWAGRSIRVADVAWSDDAIAFRFVKSSPTSGKAVRINISKSFARQNPCARVAFTIPSDSKEFQPGDTFVVHRSGTDVLLFHNGLVSVAKDRSALDQLNCMLEFFRELK